jgi:hypothetical protein
VKKRSDPDEPFIVFRNGVRPADRLQDAMCHPARTHGMLKPRVNGGWKYQVRRSELLDSPQPLKFRRVHELDFERTYLDVAMNRVAYEFSFAHQERLGSHKP